MGTPGYHAVAPDDTNRASSLPEDLFDLHHPRREDDFPSPVVDLHPKTDDDTPEADRPAIAVDGAGEFPFTDLFAATADLSVVMELVDGARLGIDQRPARAFCPTLIVELEGSFQGRVESAHSSLYQATPLAVTHRGMSLFKRSQETIASELSVQSSWPHFATQSSLNFW